MEKPAFSISKVLQMRTSPIHGKGVFARVPIPVGVRLIEYRGKRITNAVADALYPEDPEVPYHTFLFAIDGDVVIDAGRGGNMSRWINHSCDPNCDAVVDEGRVWIQSIRDIAPGEELTYDYNFVLEERHTPALKKRYKCICGTEKCRGTMLAKKR
jgi:uncharacterized protein